MIWKTPFSFFKTYLSSTTIEEANKEIVHLS